MDTRYKTTSFEASFPNSYYTVALKRNFVAVKDHFVDFDQNIYS